MTVILPGDSAAPAPRRTLQPSPPLADADYGAGLVRPREPVRRAAQLCDLDCAVAHAAQLLDARSRELLEDDLAPDRLAEAFAAEAGRIRADHAARLADGPDRDRFDEAFDLFAKATAVETRREAASRQIAHNRAELDRAVDVYAGLAADSPSPVAGEFARRRVDALIDNQVAAGVLDAAEGAERKRAASVEILRREAARFVAADPGAARDELRAGRAGDYGALPKADRAELIAEAEGRAAVADRILQTASAREAAAATADRIRRAQAFEAAFRADLGAGKAAPGNIVDALAAGTIDDATAARLGALWEADWQEAAARAEAASAVEDRLAAGGALDPGSPEDQESATAWLDLAVGGTDALFAGAPEDAALRLRAARDRLGFLPDAVQRRLDTLWASGDGRLMRLAAEATRADHAAAPDRAAFLDLMAAGLAPEDAAGRITELRRQGSFDQPPAETAGDISPPMMAAELAHWLSTMPTLNEALQSIMAGQANAEQTDSSSDPEASSPP